MPRIDRPSHAALKRRVPETTYEDVRQSFILRLRGERSRLADLAGVLGSAQVDPLPAFVALEKFAYRLRGAAAVFDFPGLREAAKVLELSAATAVSALATFDEPVVQTAIQMLAGRLTSLDAGSPLPAN